jgi:hypothetical protein
MQTFVMSSSLTRRFSDERPFERKRSEFSEVVPEAKRRRVH